jgi:hypothetical protein
MERDAERLAAKLKTALVLHESGVAMKRAQIRRAHPRASDADVSRWLADWLRERPGAELGDVVGTLRTLSVDVG